MNLPVPEMTLLIVVAYYEGFTADADDGDEWGGSMFSSLLFDD